MGKRLGGGGGSNILFHVDFMLHDAKYILAMFSGSFFCVIIVVGLCRLILTIIIVPVYVT